MTRRGSFRGLLLVALLACGFFAAWLVTSGGVALGDTVACSGGDVSCNVTWTQGAQPEYSTLFVQNTAGAGGQPISDFTFLIAGGPQITAVSGGQCSTTGVSGQIQCLAALYPGDSETISITTASPVATGTTGSFTPSDGGDNPQAAVSVPLQGGTPTGSTVTSTGTTTSTTAPTTTAQTTTAQTTTAQTTTAQTTTTPPALFAAFTAMDRKLTNAIEDAEKGKNVEREIKQIEEAKAAIVKKYMATPIDGVKGSVWFFLLDGVDYQLTRAEDDAAHGVSKTVVVAALKNARRLKEDLEEDLHRAGKSPAALLEAIDQLDRKLTKAINDAEKGKNVEREIKQIEEAKAAIVKKYMATPIYGVKGSVWFFLLDGVDYQLTQAEDDAAHGVSKTVVVAALKNARTLKEHLEDDLHRAAG